MIRVKVAASSPVVRAGLEALLREDPRFDIISANGAGPPGRHAGDARATVLLMEIASADKVSRLRSLRHDDAQPTVLLVDHLKRSELRHALQCGVRAILGRDSTGPEIMAAVEGAAAGLTVLSADEMDALLPVPLETTSPDLVPAIPAETLSTRELKVLAMMAEGMGNKDIAIRLNISEHTVKFHVSSILGKLGATTRGEAVARGVREGLITI